jgi:hypothetical protein
LISSNSLASAIKQPFFLRRVDFIAIALLLLWGLQPIASQGMLNMLYTIPHYDHPTQTQVSYLDMSSGNPSFKNGGSHFEQRNIRAVDIAFAAALMPRQPTAKKGVDNYVYPLVPALHYLDSWKNSNVTSDGWYDVTGAAAPSDYVSLFGVPVANPAAASGVPPNSTASFQMYTSYYRYICTAPVVKTWEQVNATGITPSLLASGSKTLFMYMNPPMTDHNGET